MKNSYKAALLAALGLISATAAQAAGDNNNTLWLGFSTATASSDIVIDLGLASGLVGQTSVVDLSSYLTSSEISAFNTAFTSSANGVSFSVVGGNNGFGHGDVFGTQLRVGGAGSDPSVAGSSVTELPTSASLTAAANTLQPGDWPTTQGSYASLASKSFYNQVKPGSASNFNSKGGVDPEVTIGPSGIVYADLWEVVGSSTSQSAADNYEGYFTYNYNNNSLTFTGADVPVSVPEPTTYGLLAGAGLLVVSLRNQFTRKQA